MRSKQTLVRLLFERHYSRDEVVALFRLIDWMLHLPEKQAIIFEADLESLEAEYDMPYLSSIERRALQKGIEQGLEKGLEKGRSRGRLQQLRTLLEHRFGPLPEWTVERLGKASPGLLDDWAVKLLDASRVEDVFAWPAGGGVEEGPGFRGSRSRAFLCAATLRARPEWRSLPASENFEVFSAPAAGKRSI